MKRFFSLSFQHKVVFIFLLFMNLSFLMTGYIAKNLAEKMLLQEKEEKLLTIAQILNTRLSRGGYKELLEKQGAQNTSRDEKIRVLNRALRDVTDEIGTSAPGLGVGFYSLELDAIITYGPSIAFGSNVGVSIPPDHPGREVMKTGKPLTQFGSMVRGDILNAMIPITRQNETIGYIWANELETDVHEQLNDMSRNIFIVMLLCSALVFFVLILLSRRTLRDVDSIINGVRAMREDLSNRIESTGGELAEVVENINEMAEEISRATVETNRAVSVLQNIMSNVNAMIYVCDPDSKKLVYTNDYLRRIFKREHIEGRLCYEILYGNTVPCTDCPQEVLLAGQDEPAREPVVREVHNKLINRDFLATDRMVIWHDGRLVHMEVGTDITERRALTIAKAANQAQREFLAHMSQEIRAPMNNILRVTDLAEVGAASPLQKEYFREIQISAKELLGTFNDILDYSRLEAGMLIIEKQVFNVREMACKIQEALEPRFREKQLDLIIEVDEAVPEYAIGDSLRLSQVIQNLMEGSASFTINGSVTCDIRSELRPMGILRLHCAIKDTGIGISKEQLNQLFESDMQSGAAYSDRYMARDLGLIISKALVELMGGKISARSQPGIGTEFTFFVEFEPLYGTVQDDKHDELVAAESHYAGLRVLFVEENRINQEVARTILSGLGAEVDFVNNGVDAMRAYIANQYDFIFMDLRMPVMDGLETTRRIRSSFRENARTVPIVAMSPSTLLEDRLASKDAGMNGHIAKPVEPAELKNILFQLLKAQATEK